MPLRIQPVNRVGDASCLIQVYPGACDRIANLLVSKDIEETQGKVSLEVREQLFVEVGESFSLRMCAWRRGTRSIPNTTTVEKVRSNSCHAWGTTSLHEEGGCGPVIGAEVSKGGHVEFRSPSWMTGNIR
jgi:hypothetical protein